MTRLELRMKWVFSILLTVLSGCLVVGVRDAFKYEVEKSQSIGDFVPDASIRKNDRRSYLPFVLIDISRLPHDLVLLTYDQTYRESSEQFCTIVFDSVKVEFDKGHSKTLLSDASPAASRTFSVAKGRDVYEDKAKIMLPNAIDRSESFTLQYSGRAITADARESPFSASVYYRYDGKDWTCWTLMQEWAGV